MESFDPWIVNYQDVSDGTTVLWNGVGIPRIGYGTANLEHKIAEVRAAIVYGYKLFDSAAQDHEAYENEKDIAKVLGMEQVFRDKLFLVTKLSPYKDYTAQSAYEQVKQSMENLNVEQIDLYLIHTSRCYANGCKGNFQEAWKGIERAYMEGLVRSIGVSNFNINQMEALNEVAEVRPMVVQNRHDPLTTDWEMIEWCRLNGVFYQSFSTLGRQYQPEGVKRVFGHPVIFEISERINKSPAQVVLAWALKHDLGIIPKASKRVHMIENMESIHLDLSQSIMKAIDNLSK